MFTMAEGSNCSMGSKCIMDSVIERMQDDILKGEATTKEILKIVSDIKEGNTDSKYSLIAIKSTQDLQAIAVKETKELLIIGLKDIETRRIATELAVKEDKKAVVLEQKALDKEKKDELKDNIKEKRKFRWAIYMAVILLFINTVYGFFVKYAPVMVGLPIK